MSPKNFLSFALTAIVSGLAAAASTVAILGYKAPASFPVIKGIDIPGCIPLDENNAKEEVPKQERFLKDLEKFNRQVVFIDQLTFSVFGCEEWAPPNKKIHDRFKEHFANNQFVYDENTLRYDSNAVAISGAITVNFKAVFNNLAGYSGISLAVLAPSKDSHFSDAACGENCYGAHGLYKVSVSSSEGFTANRLEPFPVSSGLIDTYQCTLEKLAAKTTWEKFVACRF